MDDRSSEFKLNLIPTSPAMADSLRHINAMSDAELRALLDPDDDPMFGEAVEAVIARRHAVDRTSR